MKISNSHRSESARDQPSSPGRREVLRAAGVGLAVPGLLAGCLGGGGGSAPLTYAATIGEARVAILKAMLDSNTSAVSAALIDGERVVWGEAFGTIDKVKHVAPDAQTMFAIGSVSKVLAAISTMILVDRGLVELDAPLVKYVTDFRMASPEYVKVTVRMLLCHQSGFPGSEGRNIFTFVPVADYAAQTRQTLATARLKHEPGELAVYCNDGFTMIEPLVAAVAHKPYAQFVQDEILGPLGMTHSRFPLTSFPDGSYAPAYDGSTRLPQEFVNAYASGGLYSTPSDMGQLAMMLVNGGVLGGRRILSAAAVAEMGRDQTAGLPLNPVPTYLFGLGWDGVAQPGLAAVGVGTWHKNGGTSYYGSEFFVAPGARLAVMLTGTTSNYGSQRLAEFILMRALAERGTIAAVPSALPGVPLAVRDPTAADLAAMAGCYDLYDTLLRLDVEPDSHTLTLFKHAQEGWGVSATGLKLRSDGSFSTDAEPLVSYRTLVAAGRRYLVKRVAPGNGHYLLELPYAQRMEPRSELSSRWKARMGQYWLVANENPQATSLNLAESLSEVPELPGLIVNVRGQIVDPAGSDTVARMCLKIPMVGCRDLNDAVIEMRGDQQWLRVGSYLFRPRSSVPTLAAGSHVVTIGGEGLAEWRRLPIRGTLSVAGCTAWRLYDDEFEQCGAGGTDGNSRLPERGEAAWLLAFGAPGAAVAVSIA